MLSYNKIFSLIIKKILRTENNIFSLNYDKTDNINLIYKASFISYDNLHFKDGEFIHFNTNKFLFLENSLNTFMIKGQRENELLDYFCKIQKVYHALNKFAFIFKYKKAKVVVNTDMELNEINETDNNVICLYQEKAKYLFRIFDVIKIINISLSNSCSFSFFAEPLCIKNPYNNIPFSKSTLYNIYYYLIERPKLLIKFNILELFFKFHECHFNLTKFLSNYEYLLREHSIKNHIRNSINDDLYEEIKIMLDIFNKNKVEKNQIHISPDFPKEIVIKVFKPYLLLFINSKHLLIPILKRKAAFKLHNKLLNFQKFNPLFGRLKITYVKKFINNEVKIVKIYEEYNDKYILFENNNNSKFLCDHLSYTHKHYIITANSYYEDSTEEEEEEDDDQTQDDDDQTQDDDDQTQDDDVSSEGFDIDNEIVYIEEG
jgi:hypothetical protein